MMHLRAILDLFPAEQLQGPPLHVLAKANMSNESVAIAKGVSTWPDILLLPDTALGLDPFSTINDISWLMNDLNGKDFVRFLPGWLLVAYERSFDLGVFSNIISSLLPNGPRAKLIAPNGMSEQQNFVAEMTREQINWVSDMLEEILELCKSMNAIHQGDVAKAAKHWKTLSEKSTTCGGSPQN